ncbi:hypothetical protein A3F06_04000 [candidate division TM6 bacterium RIFCSPHIGHO2_12_FULL_36_22]|nr:MAG: hypothetical protein A3F06_04000 [candidate division TM6 bacterium RIFCSPHIGHO2_12_FULL_36_22]
MVKTKETESKEFSGNIYIFHAFDIGDDIDLAKVENSTIIKKEPLNLPKYFKNYNQPLQVELPHPHETSYCISTKINNFGAISLTYKIPFQETFESLRGTINDIFDKYQEQSVSDASTLFKKLKRFITQPKFFHQHTSYLVIQLDTKGNHKITTSLLKEKYGSTIASLLRFETEHLSEFQKNEILKSDIGYYRGDLLIIDIESAFIYDEEYEEVLYLFEFANVQQLELHYFDRLLDQQLNIIYERKAKPLSWRFYLPFIGTNLSGDPVRALGRLKVDISVITELLENSVKLAGEPYFSEIYSTLVEKLDLSGWQEGIDRKLEIVKDIRTVYQNKIDNIREDLLTVAIIVLILVELIIAFFK